MKYSSDMPLGSMQEAIQTINHLGKVDRISSWGTKNTSEEFQEDEVLQRLKNDPEKYIAPIRGALPK